MRSFEKILKSLREDRKITQDDLATAIGVSKQAVSHYERGTRFPKREQLEALADFFNVDIDYLTGRSSVTTKLLTDEELRILNAYRAAPDAVKTAIAGALGVVREKDEAESSEDQAI